MNLMIGVMFAYVVVGLRSRRLGPREHLLLVALASAMAGLYFFFHRFM